MRRQQPQGGRIINNGSISAHTPRPFSSAYTASKHAVLGLTKSLALDGREFNIACSQIDIGNALTEMSVRMTKGVRQANGTIAVEPMVDVKHVADAVRYIAGLPLSAQRPEHDRHGHVPCRLPVAVEPAFYSVTRGLHEPRSLAAQPDPDP